MTGGGWPRAGAGAAVVLAAAALAAGPAAAPAGTGSGPRRHVVEIRGFRFRPAALEVAPGDTVVWVNRDAVPHTATSAGEARWDTGRLEEDGRGVRVVAGEGEQPYACAYHPGMRGKLVVR